jgi:hypothetical protein
LPRSDATASKAAHHIGCGTASPFLIRMQYPTVSNADDVYVEYRDVRREWEATLPALRQLRADRGWRYLRDESGLCERALRDAVNGRRMPRHEARVRLLSLATSVSS